MSVDTDGVLQKTPLEERFEVQSLDALQDRRRSLVKANAKLVALYGPFGHYDDHRKRMVEAQKIKARMDLSAGREKKPTEAEIDAAAYGSEAYGRFIDEALSEKITYLTVAADIDSIEEAIRSREEELRCRRAEMGLGG